MQKNLATSVASAMKTVWQSRELAIQTKVRVYETLLLSVLLNNLETWTLENNKRMMKQGCFLDVRVEKHLQNSLRNR